MDKLFILVVVLLCILLINYIYVTREGFNGCKYYPSVTEKCSSFYCKIHTTKKECNNHKAHCEWNIPNGKCANKENVNVNALNDSDCSKIETLSGDSFNINTVCPYSPECLGICLNDFTYTKDNLDKQEVRYRRSLIGKLKIETKGEDDQSHIFLSSRCMECVKNFHKITELLHKNSCKYK